jgi:hypothetical protein
MQSRDVETFEEQLAALLESRNAEVTRRTTGKGLEAPCEVPRVEV